MHMTMVTTMITTTPPRNLLDQARWRPWEPLLWLAALITPWLFKEHALIINEVAIVALFAVHTDTASGITSDIDAVRTAIDAAGQIDPWRKQDPRQNLHRSFEGAHRRLQQRCADGPAEHDQGRWAVGQGAEMTAFEDFVQEQVLEGRSIIGLYPPTDPDVHAAADRPRNDRAADLPTRSHDY